jgi:addiction module RelE/StbE family toxin
LPSGELKVRWLKAAIKSLEIEADYIARDDPRAAAEVVRKVYEATKRLEQYPASGRAGRVPETRELIIPGTPYLVPYRIKGKRIEILRVFHGARRWPTDF